MPDYNPGAAEDQSFAENEPETPEPEIENESEPEPQPETDEVPTS